MKQLLFCSIAYIFTLSYSTTYAQNHALVFDGTGDYVNVADNASLDITSAITVEAWVKLYGYGDFGRILIKPGSGSNSVSVCAYFLGFTSSGDRPRFGFNTTTEAVDFNTTKTVALNTWNHVAATYSSATGEAFLYLNGEMVASETTSGTLITTATDLTLGGSKSGSEPIEYELEGELEGELDEVRVWSTARSQSEIQASMYSQLTGSESNLEAYYQASNGSGSTLTDNSSNSNDGTFVNNTDWLNSGALITGTALDFDGVDEYVDLAVPALFSDMANNDFTIETWVSFDDLTAYFNRSRVFSLSVDSDNLIHVMTASDNRPGAFLRVGGTWYRWRNNSGLSLDTWYHFAMTWDASATEFKFYINGEEQTNPATSTLSSGFDNTFRLASRSDPGGSGSTNNMHHNGKLDEFRIWSTVRPQDSLIAYMHRSLNGTETGLVDYYTFDEGAGTTLTDITGGNDGIVTNMEAGDWVDSEAFFTNTVLNATGSATSSQLGLEVEDNGSSISSGESVAFKGVQNGVSNTTSDLPSGVVSRFVRTWKSEVTGTVSANLTVDASDAISGLSLANPTAANYVLLYRLGTSGSFSEVTSGSSKSDDRVTFNGVSLQDGYYTLAVDYIEWDGSSGTLWETSTNWTPSGVPTSTDNVWIPSDPGAQPNVTSLPDSPAQCQDLTIENGAHLDIFSSRALTVTGDIANEGTILVKSNYSGIASLFTEGSISGSGSFQMEQYLEGSGGATPDGLFWYVGSPVASATSNVYNAAGTDKLWSADETTQSYPQITDNSTPLNVMEGYVARLGSISTLTFTGGTFNNGNQSALGLTRTGTTETNRGYNLVSNPYPSTVSWDGATRTNLETTMWYRTHQGSTMLFDTYNATGGIGTNNNGGGAVTGDIPPTQAFWVRVPTDGLTGSLSFDNSDRSHGTASSIYRMAAEEGTVRVAISNGETSDETIILFDPSAQDTYDDYDSQKFWASLSVPQLYTTVATDTLVINGLTSTLTNPVVDLGMKVPSTGEYTIEATNITVSGESVYLEDRAMNIFQDLNAEPTYAFTSDGGNYPSRFARHFGLSITDIEDAEETTSRVYSNGSQLTVQLPEATTGILTVLDVSGREFYSTTLQETNSVLELNLNTGIYIVNIQTENGLESHKVVLK